MGWFRRSGGRHSYGVPVVPAPPPALPEPPLTPAVMTPAVVTPSVMTPSPVPTSPLRTPPPPPPPTAAPVLLAPPVDAPVLPPTNRLPDDRTPEQIGNKVAEVLWGYYRANGIPGAAAAPAPAADGQSPAYDDAYADTLVHPPVQELLPEAQPVVPAMFTPIIIRPVPATPVGPRFRIFERARPSQPLATVAVTAPVLLPPGPVAAPAVPAPPPPPPPPPPAAAPAPVPVPVPAPAPAIVPVPMDMPAQRQHVVQLGFMDGTTLDLAGDHPAAKALRAAADALTLRA